jgi:hypothetical protein
MKLITILLISITLCGCELDEKPRPGYMVPDENGMTIPEKYHRGLPIEAWGLVDGERFKPDEESRVFDRLESEGIEYEVVEYRGYDFLVWGEKDDACVQKIFINHWCE